MKLFIQLFSIILFTAFSTNTVQAQDKAKKFHTVDIKVEGVCKMCKKRIEKAALIKGVKMAEWNKLDQTMKVVFKASKVTEEDIPMP